MPQDFGENDPVTDNDCVDCPAPPVLPGVDNPNGQPETYVQIESLFETGSLSEETAAEHQPKGVPYADLNSILTRNIGETAAAITAQKDARFMRDVVDKMKSKMGSEEDFLKFLLVFQAGRGDSDDQGNKFEVTIPGRGTMETGDAVFKIQFLPLRDVSKVRSSPIDFFPHRSSEGGSHNFPTNSHVNAVGNAIFTDDFTIYVERAIAVHEVTTEVRRWGSRWISGETYQRYPGEASASQVADQIYSTIGTYMRSNQRTDFWVEKGILVAEIALTVACIATGVGALAVAGRFAGMAIRAGIFLEANNLGGAVLEFIGVPLYDGAGKAYNPLIALTRHVGEASGQHEAAARMEMAIHAMNLCMAFGMSAKTKAISAIGTGGGSYIAMETLDMDQGIVQAYENEANRTASAQ